MEERRQGGRVGGGHGGARRTTAGRVPRGVDLPRRLGDSEHLQEMQGCPQGGVGAFATEFTVQVSNKQMQDNRKNISYCTVSEAAAKVTQKR